VCSHSVRFVDVCVGHGLGDVLRQVPNPPVGVRRARQDALDVDLGAEADDVPWRGIGVVQLGHCLSPGAQRDAGIRVDEPGLPGAVRIGDPQWA
jgi:hypothetical protein